MGSDKAIKEDGIYTQPDQNNKVFEVKLTRAQQELYKHLRQTLVHGKEPDYEFLETTYCFWVRKDPFYTRDIMNGATGEIKSIRRRWTDQETRLQTLQWYNYNLAALVKKGCLRVTPNLQPF